MPSKALRRSSASSTATFASAQSFLSDHEADEAYEAVSVSPRSRRKSLSSLSSFSRSYSSDEAEPTSPDSSFSEASPPSSPKHRRRGSLISKLGFSSKSERLARAVEEGDVNQVQRLLQNSKTIDTSDALHLACSQGHVDIVSLLIPAGANVHATNVAGSTPLHVASRLGHVECVRMLVSTGCASVNVVDTADTTPLHEACRNGHTAVVQALLQRHNGRDAVMNRPDAEGRTALMEACRGGHLEMARILLDHGALWVGVVDHNGQSAKDLAKQNGHGNLVALLQHSLTRTFDLINLAAKQGWLEESRRVLTWNTAKFFSGMDGV